MAYQRKYTDTEDLSRVNSSTLWLALTTINGAAAAVELRREAGEDWLAVERDSFAVDQDRWIVQAELDRREAAKALAGEASAERVAAHNARVAAQAAAARGDGVARAIAANEAMAAAARAAAERRGATAARSGRARQLRHWEAGARLKAEVLEREIVTCTAARRPGIERAARQAREREERYRAERIREEGGDYPDG